ncbi:MAG: hypothetical protein PHR77_01805 [Kiritimatiellae bacterium]|nr:hypothetical protein [Kiritimatiellia bacterium]MDD5522444.1 hypothetical protein [Kiritimatiellia bacterium]
MKRIILIIAGFVILGIVFLCGNMFGTFRGVRIHAMEEFKMSYFNLTLNATNLNPQTKEYLKERLYWNAVVYLKSNECPESTFDFGPVDESVLRHVTGIKDCSTSSEVYESAMKKHGQKGKHPTSF